MRSVGTVHPSSVFLARALVPPIEKHDPPQAILELGSGTGSITQEIVKHMRAQDRLVGIESNKKLAIACEKNIEKYTHTGGAHIVHAHAQDAHTVLNAFGISMVDDVVCTLPFRLLPRNETKEILKEVRAILKAGGHFIFIRYIIAPANKDIVEELHDFTVVRKKLVMRNIPPAEVVVMKKNSS